MDDLASGNFVACIGWSGDISQLALDNPDLRFVIPEEGGMRGPTPWSSPTAPANVGNVAEWMNYVYDPVNAARITAFVGYNSPVEGVREELRKRRASRAALADSPLMFPDEATLGTAPRLRQTSTRTRRRSSTSGSPRSSAREARCRRCGGRRTTTTDGRRAGRWVARTRCSAPACCG